jgi:hypothetical protein
MRRRRFATQPTAKPPKPPVTVGGAGEPWPIGGATRPPRVKPFAELVEALRQKGK